MFDRGVIRSREFKQQIADFSGLKFGNITPTDLDAFIDFGNKLFVFVESKYGFANMPYGQQLAIERLVDACHNPPARYSVGFITMHKSESDIDFANTIVTKYRWNGKWHLPQSTDKTLYQGVIKFRDMFVKNNIVNIRKSA